MLSLDPSLITINRRTRRADKSKRGPVARIVGEGITIEVSPDDVDALETLGLVPGRLGLGRGLKLLSI